MGRFTIGCLLAMLAALAALSPPNPSRAQEGPVLFRFVEELAGSRTGQQVIGEIAGNSALARQVLTELGVAAPSNAEAASLFGSYTARQQGEAMLLSNSAASLVQQTFRTNLAVESITSPNFKKYEDLTAAINSYRLASTHDTLAAVLHQPPLPAAATLEKPLLSLDIGSGDVKLSKPIVLCTNPWCEVKLEKIPFPTGTTPAIGGATACALTAPCRGKLSDWLSDLNQKTLSPSPNIRTLQWYQCPPYPDKPFSHWCNLQTVSFPTTGGGYGVYIVWNVGKTGSNVVSIGGGGDIYQELGKMRNLLGSLDYRGVDALRVTWTSVLPQDAAGVQRYLVEKYSPEFGPQFQNPLFPLVVRVTLP
jgi:hypothetical protein